ncbi:hypothetical protein ACQ4PT_055198 [Festuca glaucescens]
MTVRVAPPPGGDRDPESEWEISPWISPIETSERPSLPKSRTTHSDHSLIPPEWRSRLREIAKKSKNPLFCVGLAKARSGLILQSKATIQLKPAVIPTNKAGAEVECPHEDRSEAALDPAVLMKGVYMEGGNTAIQGGIKGIRFMDPESIPTFDSQPRFEDREESAENQFGEAKETARQRYNSAMNCMHCSIKRKAGFWGGGHQGPQPRAAIAEAGSSSNLGRRPGKELVQEFGTSAERKALVVSMGKGRGAARVWYMAVGIFLSMLTITSMKKIWKTSGIVDMSPLEGYRFVLEFVEEGDFTHVTKGGPWRYRDDAVLIESLKEGEDLSAIVFGSVPWAQFKEIPFYLLSKDLARELARRVGEYMSIDKDSRGDIFSMIPRARVRLPLDVPLLRWIVLLDEVTKEEVVVSIAYERLPSLCYHYGIIGHQGARCSLLEEMKMNGYKLELGVPPTHFKDPRR